MNWLEDDYQPKAKRRVGRPVENPFCSPEQEEDFRLRGEAMLRLYYKPEGPNTRLDFVFGPDRAISKTQFWSFIYLYYTTDLGLRKNLQGFLNAVQRHFGPQVASDRTSISQCVGMLDRLYVNLKHSGEVKGDYVEVQKKYRSKYQYVVKTWKEVALEE